MKTEVGGYFALKKRFFKGSKPEKRLSKSKNIRAFCMTIKRKEEITQK
jgi:hypothetical protein